MPLPHSSSSSVPDSSVELMRTSYVEFATSPRVCLGSLVSSMNTGDKILYVLCWQDEVQSWSNTWFHYLRSTHTHLVKLYSNKSKITPVTFLLKWKCYVLEKILCSQSKKHKNLLYKKNNFAASHLWLNFTTTATQMRHTFFIVLS